MKNTPTTIAWPRRAALLTVLAVLATAGLWAGWRVLGAGEEIPMTSGGISEADLVTAADTRVFFGHQSVGMNILDGIPAVYEGRASKPPVLVETNTPLEGPGVAHAFIGQNTDPVGKLADAERLLSGGLGSWADVALIKFCYVDVTAGSDVPRLFAEYQRTLSELESAYPDTTFLYVTVPLTTDPGFTEKVKGLVGRGNSSAADNAAREQFNDLLRREYADTGRIFDLAAIESTAPDGSRVSGQVDGRPYYALYRGYAADEGHLTPAASAMVAERLLAAVASQRS
jgi:hypothetical protein